MSVKDYQTRKKYRTKNGFKAELRYLSNGYLVGHIIAPECATGIRPMHWTLDGLALGVDSEFDLIIPENESQKL